MIWMMIERMLKMQTIRQLMNIIMIVGHMMMNIIMMVGHMMMYIIMMVGHDDDMMNKIMARKIDPIFCWLMA